MAKDDGGDYNKFDIIIRYFIIIHNFSLFGKIVILI